MGCDSWGTNFVEQHGPPSGAQALLSRLRVREALKAREAEAAESTLDEIMLTLEALDLNEAIHLIETWVPRN